MATSEVAISKFIVSTEEPILWQRLRVKLSVYLIAQCHENEQFEVRIQGFLVAASDGAECSASHSGLLFLGKGPVSTG
jgi:hypothetical protein